MPPLPPFYCCLADLEDDQKGLLSDRREIAIRLQVQVTCLDM